MTTDRELFFYSLTLPELVPLNYSANLRPRSIYFSTGRQMELWKKKHPETVAGATLHVHQISVKCIRELAKLSKKKIKARCGECGQ